MKDAATGREICGAKTRSGTPCQRPPLKGRTRCKLHGGASPVGIASPQFKDGTRSKYMPARLLETYRQSLEDPELLELRSDIALTDARLVDLLKRADTGEAGAVWRKARVTLNQFKTARAKGDVEGMTQHLYTLEQVIEQGATDSATWYEIFGVLEQRRKLVESERRRLVDMQQMITAENAMTLVASLAAIVRRHVTDQRILAAISNDLVSIVNHQSGQPDRAASIEV